MNALKVRELQKSNGISFLMLNKLILLLLNILLVQIIFI